MGLFKQMKDMKDAVESAPGMVRAAREMGAQAQEMAGAQQAAAQAQMAQFNQTATATAPGAGDLEPISGVSIELYVEISKGLADYDYDQSKGPELAAARGVGADSWTAAVDGWNTRIRANPAIAQHFNRLYTGR